MLAAQICGDFFFLHCFSEFLILLFEKKKMLILVIWMVIMN